MNSSVIALRENELTKKELINQFCKMRYGIRRFDNSGDRVRSCIKTHRENIDALKATGSPFIRRQVERRETLIAEAQSVLDGMRKNIKAYAEHLLGLCDQLDTLLTLDQRFDLINTNVADRARYIEKAAELRCELGMLKLLTVFSAEDSALWAEWRNPRVNTRLCGTVGSAMSECIIDAIMANRGARESVREGFRSVFGDLPTYRRNGDGEMVRDPVELSVVRGSLDDDGEATPRMLH
jgi:hypothetical protein